jgi:hypothetical protein
MGGLSDTTSAAYQSAWSNWSDWCVREETYPMFPPIAKILDFLSSLVSDEKANNVFQHNIPKFNLIKLNLMTLLPSKICQKQS